MLRWLPEREQGYLCKLDLLDRFTFEAALRSLARLLENTLVAAGWSEVQVERISRQVDVHAVVSFDTECAIALSAARALHLDLVSTEGNLQVSCLFENRLADVLLVPVTVRAVEGFFFDGVFELVIGKVWGNQLRTTVYDGDDSSQSEQEFDLAHNVLRFAGSGHLRRAQAYTIL